MRKKHVHFIGIKGVGMTALAVFCLEMGYRVSGSDLAEEFVTDSVLKKFKIPFKVGFERDDLKQKPDLVIVSGAHGGKTNPEAVKFILEGVKVITHGQAVGRFMEGKYGISVCGVGGKTTTSAMIATVLVKAGLDPSYVVGVGSIDPLKSPGHFGKGDYFVAEADEYASCPLTDLTPRFLYQNPSLEVITNLEYDHPDIYKNFSETKKAFLSFTDKVPSFSGLILISQDNANNRQFQKEIKRPLKTYGFSPDADFRIDNVAFTPGKTFFDLYSHNLLLGRFTLNVPGKFNALNAASTVAVGLHLGLSIEQIKTGLKAFKGTKRRFEFKGMANGVKLYDDYAHHPTEIKMTLLACRDWYPKHKIICIFQPHTFSRTKALLSSFAQSFGLADEVIILPIFASAREASDPTINSAILVSQISRYHPRAVLQTNSIKLMQYLKTKIQPKTILLTMGAGDVYKLDDKILKNLSG